MSPYSPYVNLDPRFFRDAVSGGSDELKIKAAESILQGCLKILPGEPVELYLSTGSVQASTVPGPVDDLDDEDFVREGESLAASLANDPAAILDGVIVRRLLKTAIKIVLKIALA